MLYSLDLRADRLSAASGDLDLAWAARFPPCLICAFRAASRSTPFPPLRLFGFLRQLCSSCSDLPGTGSYPGQQRDVLVRLFLVAIGVEKGWHETEMRGKSGGLDDVNFPRGSLQCERMLLTA